LPNVLETRLGEGAHSPRLRLCARWRRREPRYLGKPGQRHKVTPIPRHREIKKAQSAPSAANWKSRSLGASFFFTAAMPVELDTLQKALLDQAIRGEL